MKRWMTLIIVGILLGWVVSCGGEVKPDDTTSSFSASTVSSATSYSVSSAVTVSSAISSASSSLSVVILKEPDDFGDTVDLTKGVNKTNKSGDTPLMIAAFNGDLEEVENLVKKGAAINVRGKKGWTALTIAACQGHTEIVEFLLSKGARTTIKDDNGVSPLSYSILFEQGESLSTLLKYGATPNTQDKDGWTPLMFSTFYSLSDVAEELIEKGANLNVQNNDGNTALLIAIENENEDLAAFYIEKKADLSIKNKSGKSALILAKEIGLESLAETIAEQEKKSKPVVAPQNMIIVNGDKYMMGDKNEKNLHEVRIGSFMIGSYEVTQEDWESVMGYNNSQFKGAKLPVDSISWYEAVEYCNKKSQMEGLTPCYEISKDSEDPNNMNDSDTVKWTVTFNPEADGYRLPTAAEWEFAARGGKSSKGYTYSGGNNADEVGWNMNNSDKTTHPVGKLKPNELGIYDMSGNVYEWCWDWYDSSYYKDSPSENPLGADSGSSRTVRGGSYNVLPSLLQSSFSYYSSPHYTSRSIGMRVVRSIK